MLKISTQQMQVLENFALRNFENEMMEHSKIFSPRLCKVLGDEQLRIALRQAIRRATAYGFTNRGPIRLYIELMFLCGSDFDTDPLYPDLGKVLNTRGEQMQRAEQIYQGMLDHREKVSGPDNIDVLNALEALSDIVQQPITYTENNVESQMLKQFTDVFPQQVEYAGDEKFTALIQEGRAKAKAHHFISVRAETMMVILMFAFGHGCTDDPLYPWIADTLSNSKIVDAVDKARRLEQKARTWLEHVIAGNRKGVQV